MFFLYMITLPDRELQRFILNYALIPSRVFAGADLSTLITSIFLHASFGHIIGNMIFLNIFGDNLEDYLGKIKYIFFYLACGLGASLLQIFIDPTSQIPNLGASGAIAGLMGGYLVLYPRHKVDVLLPIGLFFSQTSVPAYTMLFYWILAQFLFGFGQVAVAGQGGVAYWAHIGGFITGVVLIYLFKASRKET